LVFLTRRAFVRSNRRAIAMMVRSSVRLSGTGVHCDHVVHFTADLTLWLDCPKFWAPWHHSQSSFQFNLEERWGMDVQARRRIKR